MSLPLPMNWPEFHHEAMATEFALIVAHPHPDYARQAALAAWRELDRLEAELSRFVESSDIARANRLACGESLLVGDDTLHCLLLAAEVAVATNRAFDAAYASVPLPDTAPDAPRFTLDPENHTLTSRAASLRLDLGAIGKGYALDRLAAMLADWEITSACLQSGGSTALALEPPSGESGWPIGLGEGAARRVLSLTHAALSGSGIAVKGEHLRNPRAGGAAARSTRVWAFAETAALSDAVSTAFFVMSDAEVAAFCGAHPEVGAALAQSDGSLAFHGALGGLVSSCIGPPHFPSGRAAPLRRRADPVASQNQPHLPLLRAGPAPTLPAMPASLRPPLLKFPRRFVWGVAAAAPQIEGAAFEDGKAASIWDTFARQPGAVHKGDTLDVACDHYHRFDRDFALMASLGVRHYRLSLAWPRIFPHGDRTLNQRGLDFYHQIFDSLERHGITPWVTMFHWDLPQALEDRGGWRSPEVVDAFAHYADTIVRAYGARVRHWITLNEIHCFTLFGYGGGGKAPGTSEPAAVVNQTYHHALLCHGHGVRAVREHGRRGARVGLTDVPFNAIPVTETAPDIAAARAVFVEDNIRVLDPIHRGRYATSYLRRAGRDAPRHHARDFDLISLPTDFLGLNVYTGTFVRRGARGRPERISFPASYPTADCTWLKHVPQSIYWGPRFATELYAPASIYITENGAGYEDAPPVAGQVDDLHRRDLVRNYLRELHRAITDGVPVDGYFLWSFMDNFEWQDGYSKRFGIVYTDYATQRRIPKLSARWYSQVIAHNALI